TPGDPADAAAAAGLAARSGGTILSRIACWSLSSSRGNSGEGELALRVAGASGRTRPSTGSGQVIAASPSAIHWRRAGGVAGKAGAISRAITPKLACRHHSAWPSALSFERAIAHGWV